jgi:heme/copper-type cytochrome/quinol oxidase subunit 4
MDNKTNNFIEQEVLKNGNKLFIGSIISIAIGYTIITVWLNSIRATASLWFVWVLILIQFALYFLIFITSYRRSKVLGLNQSFAWIIFIVLTILGRINDWELFVIPSLLLIMIILSVSNKKVSDKR